jgi:hypothetical protein
LLNMHDTSARGSQAGYASLSTIIEAVAPLRS